jgi:hypothetical protein
VANEDPAPAVLAALLLPNPTTGGSQQVKNAKQQHWGLGQRPHKAFLQNRRMSN